MPQTKKIVLKHQIFVKSLGTIINVNKTPDGFAYDGEGNTYQLDSNVWKKICCPNEDEPVLSQSDGGAPKNHWHSVPVR